MPEIAFRAEQTNPVFLCVAGSVTTGARQAHAAKSNKKQNPYEKVKQEATEDSSEPLPGAFEFSLWPPLKVLEVKPLHRGPGPWRPCARIGCVRRNGDTKRSKLNEIVPPGVDAIGDGHPWTAKPNE